jgi:hypothetical protein
MVNKLFGLGSGAHHLFWAALYGITRNWCGSVAALLVFVQPQMQFATHCFQGRPSGVQCGFTQLCRLALRLDMDEFDYFTQSILQQ